MIRHRTSPHEIARAAVESAIRLGQVAHHSGAADDLYRRVATRARQLGGATRSSDAIAVELHATADGYWDTIIPAGDAARIRERGAWA